MRPPEGQRGEWRVVQTPGPYIAPDGSIVPMTITELRRGNVLVMRDTPDEIEAHESFLADAKGRVLIAGLGLGLAPASIADRVERITVIENSREVIELVEPWLRARAGDRLEVIQADATQWAPSPGERWDLGWFDIFDSCCEANIPTIDTTASRWSAFCDRLGFWGDPR